MPGPAATIFSDPGAAGVTPVSVARSLLVVPISPLPGMAGLLICFSRRSRVALPGVDLATSEEPKERNAILTFFLISSYPTLLWFLA